MAEPFTANRKSQLIASLVHSRADLSRSSGKVRESLDIGAHFRDSVNRQKGAWIVGATVVGWALARFLGRSKPKTSAPLVLAAPQSKQKERAALLLTFLNMAVTLFKPAVTACAFELVKNFGTGKDGRSRWFSK